MEEEGEVRTNYALKVGWGLVEGSPFPPEWRNGRPSFVLPSEGVTTEGARAGLKIQGRKKKLIGKAGVAKWQTRWTQNPVSAMTCGFKSLLRHSKTGRPSGRPSRPNRL